mgnify:CR=1 FL=1
MTPKVMVDVTVLPTFSSARSLSMEANLSSSCIPDLSNPSFSHRYGSLYPARKSRLFLERERERERERDRSPEKKRLVSAQERLSRNRSSGSESLGFILDIEHRHTL